MKSIDKIKLSAVTELATLWMASHKGLKGPLFNKILKLLKESIDEAYIEGVQTPDL